MKPIKQLPKTVPEYAAALTESKNEGAANALEIVLFVLLDKFGWNTDELQELMSRVAEQAQAVTDRRITIKDLRHVLRDEYGVEV